jgi:hypothetical protein
LDPSAGDTAYQVKLKTWLLAKALDRMTSEVDWWESSDDGWFAWFMCRNMRLFVCLFHCENRSFAATFPRCSSTFPR